MNVLAVILARAGSVGLPNKHLLPLLAKPVIAYTFDHAKAARSITRLIVSTDCPQVRRLAINRGIETISRPPRLATSDASVQDVMLHAMDTIECTSTFRADALIVLYGNVPVRGSGVVDEAVRKLNETGCDSVRTFCPVGKWHPAWMSRLDGDRVEALHPGSIHRRQDLERLFLHDGAVVALSRSSMLRGRAAPDDPHAFFGVDRRGIETRAGDTVEIDERRDLFWAEAVLREQAGESVRAAI
ncbi:MAG TPA: acylneuraminate cytidylyltransferase family protein [Tepidisphaeraceae bacterium]|jgi:N-acylneuraminate cytidylyltransferase|nr:acylneuraminate cytidylyltransferase family protein [Tepidisphaeraceae bacterium]